MYFLRITAATTGIKTYIPEGFLVNVVTAADTLDAGSSYRAPNVVRGKITALKYTDGAAAASPTITSVTSITAYAGTGTAKYEFGCMTIDGAFSAALSN
jgi:hypothetical protein